MKRRDPGHIGHSDPSRSGVGPEIHCDLHAHGQVLTGNLGCRPVAVPGSIPRAGHVCDPKIAIMLCGDYAVPVLVAK